MSRIMVPLDGSEFSEQALPYAFGIARRSGAELHLVRVHTPPQVEWLSNGFLPIPITADEDLREADVQYLDRMVEYTAMHVERTPKAALLTGQVARALETYVEAHGIDLVIMTTHGRTGLSRAWIGSVADALVRTVHAPVLLLRPRAGQAAADAKPIALDHILIPIDESEYSAEILGPALDLGKLTCARYTLLQILSPPLSVPSGDAIALPLQFARAVELRVEAAARLEELARRLRAQGHDVDTAIVIHGQVAHGVLEQAVGLKADLIAMSTHGRRGLARFTLGSVTDKVVRGTSVPLLLWKPPTNRFSEAEDAFASRRDDQDRHLSFAYDGTADTAHATSDAVRPPV